MKKIPIGKDDFKKLIEEDCYYVDETKLIEEIVSNGTDIFLFPRPRRFGKSLNISMLENFFDIEKKEENKDLFQGLYISTTKYRELQNTYPVINLSLKDLKQGTFEAVIEQFKLMMMSIYSKHRYVYEILDEGEKKYFDSISLRTGNINDFKLSLKNLTDYLCKYHQKQVIVLIDEYDVPIQQGYLGDFYNEVVDFIRSIFLSTLKTNTSVYKCVLTGVLRVSKESIFSDLNNVNTYGIYDSKFGEYFGFKGNETKELLSHFGMELTTEVKEMYDGYDFNGVSIYNPWSILKYVENKSLNTYWVNTSGNDLLKKVLIDTKEENKVKIEELVQGKSQLFVYNDKITYLDFNDHDNWDNILNLMFSSGYLTIDKIEEIEERVRTYVKIPNKEVKTLITNLMAGTVAEKSQNYFLETFMDAITTGDKKSMEKLINEALSSTSYMDSQEYFYHAYLLGMFKICLDSKYFIVKSNREAGVGRFDVMIERVDRSYGYIFEFKLAKKEEDMESLALVALNQMKEKEYYKELELDQVKEIHEISIVFKDKSCIVR